MTPTLGGLVTKLRAFERGCCGSTPEPTTVVNRAALSARDRKIMDDIAELAYDSVFTPEGTPDPKAIRILDMIETPVELIPRTHAGFIHTCKGRIYFGWE